MANQRQRSEMEEVWRSRIAAWEGSGQTARAFCRERDFSEWSFYRWRRRLRATGAAGKPAAEPPAPRFIPLTVVDGGPRSHDESAIEIAVPAGVVVRVIGAPPPVTITTVLAAIGLRSETDTC